MNLFIFLMKIIYKKKNKHYNIYDKKEIKNKNGENYEIKAKF